MIETAYRIGMSREQIGGILGRHKSTVSRELARSLSAPGSRSPKRHTARNGDQGYLGSSTPSPLREQVGDLLGDDWSTRVFPGDLESPPGVLAFVIELVYDQRRFGGDIDG